MAVPNEYASNLIAALRGGVRDTGRASGYELLPNPVLGYGAIRPRARPARAALSSPAILRMTPAERRQEGGGGGGERSPIYSGGTVSSGAQLDSNVQPEQVTDTGDETARLLARYPVAQSYPVTQSGSLTLASLKPLTPSVDVSQPQDVTNAPAIPWNPDELFSIDQELGNIQQSDVREVGTAAFPEDFGYVDPSNVPVVDRSVPSMSDANWGMASEPLMPDWAVDTAFGVKSATENPLVSTVFPIASAVGGGLADATLDAQIDRLANQYAAIETGNNLGYGTSVDSSGAVSYQAPVETRDIFGGSYFPQESYFNAYDFGNGFDVVGCPAPWVKIQMADGSTIQAGDLKPGMQVWTQHEHTEQWGAYPVIAVSTVDNNRQRLLLEDGREFVGSDNHRVKTNNGWTQIVDLKPGDKIAQEHGEAVVKQIIELDAGPVVKITVQDAHTYVSEGFLSHNVKMEPSFGGFGGGGGSPIGFGNLDHFKFIVQN